MIGGPHELPEQVYRSDSGLNISALKHMRDCPAKAQWHLANPKKQTPEMAAGTALHMAILEPERFLRSYAPRPDVNGATKAGKAALAEARGSGRELIAADDYDGFMQIAEQIRGSEFFSRFVNGGQYEKSWFLEHESGRRLKCRTDIYLPDMNVIVDIKTTVSAATGKFYRSVKDFAYDAQAAYYSDIVSQVTGRLVSGFVFLVIERGENRGIRAFFAGPRLMDRGRRLYRTWLSQWLYCEASGKWPGYAEELQTLEVPAWELDNSEEF